MSDRIDGWDEIGAYIGKHGRTAMKYAHTRKLPFHKVPGGGSKARVFAFRHELDSWLSGVKVDTSHTARRGSKTQIDEIAAPVLSRILGIGQETKLYRRNYVLRFDLRPASRGVEIKLACSFEMCNAAESAERFVQEMTVDDSDQGTVESMSFHVNGNAVYVLKRPQQTEKFMGYVSYKGPEQRIEPTKARAIYICRASWVIHREVNDIWYNHMILPTVGVKIKTTAMPGFQITPSFSLSGLVMKGEHLDVAWRKRN